MTEEIKAPRKRRSVEELKAFHAAELKRLDENDKREAIRLLSGAYDDVQKATTYKLGPPTEAVGQNLKTATEQLKQALAKLGIK